jgi:hypothetical protein
MPGRVVSAARPRPPLVVRNVVTGSEDVWSLLALWGDLTVAASLSALRRWCF